MTEEKLCEESLFDSIPFEIFEIILKKMDGVTLGKCRRVCKDWREIIDSSENLWYQKCRMEFKHASRIAKRKASNHCTWYHIYKNLFKWSRLKEYDLKLSAICKVNIEFLDSHILEIDKGVLPVRTDTDTVLYDGVTLETMSIVFPSRDCCKISNTDAVTILQIKTFVVIQRTVCSPEYAERGFCYADDFILTADDRLYYHYNNNIFSMDLTQQEFTEDFIARVEDRIKYMSYSDHVIYLFNNFGHIVSIDLNQTSGHKVKYIPINCPAEWSKLMKNVSAVDDKNYVCFNSNLIKIETDQYRHMFLEFPEITALFFYVDFIIFGTTAGQILVYRMSTQPQSHRQLPVFESLASLPPGKLALQIDVCERRTGPLVVITSYNKLYFLEIPFFPHEQKTTEFTPERLMLQKRLQRLKDKINFDKVQNIES